MAATIADDREEAAPAWAIQARGVTRSFGGALALEDLDLEVAAGTIFGFIGPSGAGKTTAVRLLAGADSPTSGEISVLGRSPASFDAATRMRIGYMPQQSVLYPHLSIQENLNFVASMYGMPLRRKDKIDKVLEFVELDEHRKKQLRHASGGMQRRLALAAALIHDPDVLLLDEPTAGVDPVLRQTFWQHFAELKEQGRTLFVTTQYVGEAANCDLVGVLGPGRLIALGTPEELRRKALGGEAVEVTLEAAPQPATVEALTGQPGVRDVELIGQRRLRVLVDRADRAIPSLQDWFRDSDTRLESIREDVPSFDDVFVALMQEHRR